MTSKLPTSKSAIIQQIAEEMGLPVFTPEITQEEPDEKHLAITRLLDSCLGKTIATWAFNDRPYGGDLPWPGEGITLTFTDGSTLKLREHMQAGEIRYSGG